MRIGVLLVLPLLRITIANMTPLVVPSNLPTLVKEAFVRAQASGDLIYFPTQVAILTSGSLVVGAHNEVGITERSNNSPLVPAPIFAFTRSEAQDTETRRTEHKTLQSLRKPLSALAHRTASALP